MIRIPLLGFALLLILPALPAAQDMSDKQDGILCVQPQCDIRKSLPRSVTAPLEAESHFVERVRNSSASALDPKLPTMSFELWLFLTLQPQLTRPLASFANWSLSFCDEPKSAFPRASPDLCIHVKVPLAGERLVNVHIGVADDITSAAGETGWREIHPKVRDIYVERLDPDRLLEQYPLDSLDVDSLATLQARVSLPFRQWPAVDFRSAVSRSRGTSESGNVVRFTISVRNVGPRDADRAAVSFLLSIPQEIGESRQLRREWFPRIPAGETVSFDISAPVPRGDATAIVSVRTAMGFKRVREINSDDNDAVVHFTAPQ